MKIWLIVGVVILLLPFCLADTCEDTCLSLGYDYAECRELNEDSTCENSEEDIGFVSCTALERCCCGFDVEVVVVEAEPETEVTAEDTEIILIDEEELVVVEEANDTEIVVVPVIINTVPSVSTSSTSVAEGETAVFTVEVKNNYFTYLWKKVFRTTDNVYVYDAEGDGVYFNLIGDSGFENSTVLLYTGFYSFGWVTSEGDAGVYTDMLYVWDDEHVDSPVIVSYTTTVNKIVELEIVEEVVEIPEEEEVIEEEEEVNGTTVVIDEESCSASETNYARFLSFVLLIFIVVLIILYVFTDKKKEDLFE